MGTFRGAGETSLEITLSSTDCIESHITQKLRSVERVTASLITQ